MVYMLSSLLYYKKMTHVLNTESTANSIVLLYYYVAYEYDSVSDLKINKLTFTNSDYRYYIPKNTIVPI